jgi:murein L,D-transpeptidase YcbB/YkuD
VEDLLPRQQRDADFLSRKGIRVYRKVDGDWTELAPSTIDWSLYHEDNFPFIFKQDAGAGNSLGQVKFYLPNNRAIYLHDTPFTGLFQRSQRAFSSGCVRVEGANRLAHLLMARAAPQEAKRFNRAIERGETLIAQLNEPVPVYLTYFTSWVDETGVLHFRPDIYRRDTDLLSAISVEKWPTPPRLAGSALKSL